MQLDSLRFTENASYSSPHVDIIMLAIQILPCAVLVSVEDARTDDGNHSDDSLRSGLDWDQKSALAFLLCSIYLGSLKAELGIMSHLF